MMPHYNTLLKLVATILLYSIVGACTSLGPSKPNDPFAGPYPDKFNQLNYENPLLAKEVGKLPELQDGISDSEAKALERLSDVYAEDPESFDKAFNEMYKIGKPEVRKYCTPLQALFWLTQKDIEETRRQLEYFHLESLFEASWEVQEGPILTLSEQEAKKVINSVKSDEQKNEYYAFLDRIEVLNNLILADFRNNPNIFSQEARKIITSSQYVKEELKWDDPENVIDRLNSPEIFEYWFARHWTYHHSKRWKGAPRKAQPAYTSIKKRMGVCHDLANLACVCLKRAGYEVTGLNVYFKKRDVFGGAHSVCILIEKELDKKVYYRVADRTDFGKVKGPYGSIEEVAKDIAGYQGVKRYTTGRPGFD